MGLRTPCDVPHIFGASIYFVLTARAYFLCLLSAIPLITSLMSTLTSTVNQTAYSAPFLHELARSQTASPLCSLPVDVLMLVLTMWREEHLKTIRYMRETWPFAVKPEILDIRLKAADNGIRGLCSLQRTCRLLHAAVQVREDIWHDLFEGYIEFRLEHDTVLFWYRISISGNRNVVRRANCLSVSACIPGMPTRLLIIMSKHGERAEPKKRGEQAETSSAPVQACCSVREHRESLPMRLQVL